MFPETSAHIRTTWRYIPEDGEFRNYRCENLKSYVSEHVSQTYKTAGKIIILCV
jgi:hypothetical protein